MIKGVNKQIVEVNDTGSPFFDKILFILSAAAAEKTDIEIFEHMHKLLNTYDLTSPVFSARKKRQRLKTAAAFLLTAAAGAFLTLVIVKRFF